MGCSLICPVEDGDVKQHLISVRLLNTDSILYSSRSFPIRTCHIRKLEAPPDLIRPPSDVCNRISMAPGCEKSLAEIEEFSMEAGTNVKEPVSSTSPLSPIHRALLSHNYRQKIVFGFGMVGYSRLW